MRTAMPFTHFTKAGTGLLFNLAPCPVCTQVMRSGQTLPLGSNTADKLKRAGLVELSLLPPAQKDSPMHGTLVCETCARIDPSAVAIAEPVAVRTRLAPRKATVDPFVASEAVATLESVWAELRAAVSDVPDAVLVLASGTEDVRTPKFGHWAASRWRIDDIDTRRAEVLIAGEALEHGPEQVLSTLLHEAAHGLAHTRGIKDTSRQGRYHNHNFRLVAEELGLEVRSREPHGHCDTRLNSLGKLRWASSLEELAALCARGSRPPRPRPRRSMTAAPTSGQRKTSAPAARVGSAAPIVEEVGEPRLTGGVRIVMQCACAA